MVYSITNTSWLWEHKRSTHSARLEHRVTKAPVVPCSAAGAGRRPIWASTTADRRQCPEPTRRLAR